MPASFRASRTASAPISIADLPGSLPNGCRPTPMIATSGTGLSLRLGCGHVVGGECGDHYLVAHLLGAEREHDDADLLPAPRLAVPPPPLPALHPPPPRHLH